MGVWSAKTTQTITYSVVWVYTYIYRPAGVAAVVPLVQQKASERRRASGWISSKENMLGAWVVVWVDR